MGTFLAKIWLLYGRKYRQNSYIFNLSSFCDLVHVQSINDLFAKQLNNVLNLPKITKIRAKLQNHGRYTGDVPQMPIYTAALVKIRAAWAHWACPPYPMESHWIIDGKPLAHQLKYIPRIDSTCQHPPFQTSSLGDCSQQRACWRHGWSWCKPVTRRHRMSQSTPPWKKHQASSFTAQCSPLYP